ALTQAAPPPREGAPPRVRVRVRRRGRSGGRGRLGRGRAAEADTAKGPGGVRRAAPDRATVLEPGRKARPALCAPDVHHVLAAREKRVTRVARPTNGHPARALPAVQLRDGLDDLPLLPAAPGEGKEDLGVGPEQVGSADGRLAAE